MESRSRAGVIVLAMAALGVLTGLSCRRCDDKRLPIPIPISVDPMVSDAAPMTPEAAAPPVSLEEGVFEKLPAVGSYSNKSQCLRLTSKAVTEEQWGIPYPVRLVVVQLVGVHAVDLDCGLFPAVQQGGWRLGYCLEENKRVPRKVYLRVQEGKLAVQVDYRSTERTTNIYTGFEPGECK